MFPEEERKIFCYRAGGREMIGDPFAITRRLVRWCDGDVGKVMADRYAGYPPYQEDESGNPVQVEEAQVDPAQEPIRFDAENKIIRASYEAFGLPPWDNETGEGVSEEEALRVFDEFCAWVAEQKKTTESRPTYSPPSPAYPRSSVSASSTDSGYISAG